MLCSLCQLITSANLNVVFNASAVVSPHAITGRGIDRQGDTGLDAYAVGDFAQFYVLISDIDNTQSYQIAYNSTIPLGQDSGNIATIADTIMDSVPEGVLIGLLTAVLATDDYNFTITLGIDIYCEDNEYGADEDQFNLLLFKSFNLTFSYEKKIDKFTSLAWNQIADQITGTDIDIVNASLNFKYKIDQLWPVIDSPNSEIRVYINSPTCGSRSSTYSRCR